VWHYRCRAHLGWRPWGSLEMLTSAPHADPARGPRSSTKSHGRWFRLCCSAWASAASCCALWYCALLTAIDVSRAAILSCAACTQSRTRCCWSAGIASIALMTACSIAASMSSCTLGSFGLSAPTPHTFRGAMKCSRAQIRDGGDQNVLPLPSRSNKIGDPVMIIPLLSHTRDNTSLHDSDPPVEGAVD